MNLTTLKVPTSTLISQQPSTYSSLSETLTACAEWTPSPIHGYNRSWADGYAWQDVVCTPQQTESLETCNNSHSKLSGGYIVIGPNYMIHQVQFVFNTNRSLPFCITDCHFGWNINSRSKLDCPHATGPIPGPLTRIDSPMRPAQCQTVYMDTHNTKPRICHLQYLLPSIVKTAECGFRYEVILGYDGGDSLYDTAAGQEVVKKWFQVRVAGTPAMETPGRLTFT